MMYDDNARVQKHDGSTVVLVFSFTPGRLPEGRVTVEIKPWKPRRSLPQNALFHALCGEIARITGMDSTLVKEGVKDLCGPKIPGIHGRLIHKPSHLCDKLEMADLIMGAEVELTEAGGDPRMIQNSLT
jgi:hypothetical protein